MKMLKVRALLENVTKNSVRRNGLGLFASLTHCRPPVNKDNLILHIGFMVHTKITNFLLMLLFEINQLSSQMTMLIH